MDNKPGLLPGGIDRLLPQKPWQILFVYIPIVTICLLLYYLVGCYGGFDSQYENLRWSSCGSDTFSECETNNEITKGSNLFLIVNVPLSVADFIDQDVKVTLVNKSGTPVSKTVVLRYDAPDPRTHIYFTVMSDKGPLDQTLFTFTEVAPFASVTQYAKIRVSGAQNGMSFKPTILVDGESFTPGYQTTSYFNSASALKFWVIGVFLVPPGSNWVVSFVALWICRLIVWWVEELPDQMKRDGGIEQKQNAQQTSQSKWDYFCDKNPLIPPIGRSLGQFALDRLFRGANKLTISIVRVWSSLRGN